MKWPWSKSDDGWENPRWWGPEWDRVSSAYPIGRTFIYLTRQLLVTQHDRDTSLYPYCRPKPRLICEYCDDNGKLHEWVFEVPMFKLLP